MRQRYILRGWRWRQRWIGEFSGVDFGPLALYVWRTERLLGDTGQAGQQSLGEIQRESKCRKRGIRTVEKTQGQGAPSFKGKRNDGQFGRKKSRRVRS